MKKVIFNNIKILRENNGEMSQQKLAEAIGVTRQTIIAIEKNKYSPSLEVAFKIALEFDVPLDEVFVYK
ncbi:helix-turn-helix transcriptional regulator [Hellea sp.]|mgnify:FL=1|nr:helix-turn-helix transcriptional regulator [Hellea sp.]MDA8887513.1 helix-turn-helix transcriptional regulator [Hellea sp.]MDA9047987.1 helix-turn-helix transcriptional regulator [Hellea sp.]MDB4844317.1 helix-turn-helix transcriptional regulator [Hellea sp.]MDC0421739.1 helix-turn-helix transcriptional regulator [Hellea sp.]MDC1061190.1 helix-turn-helix transcriptional regulator [Hellea sp.]